MLKRRTQAPHECIMGCRGWWKLGKQAPFVHMKGFLSLRIRWSSGKRIRKESVGIFRSNLREKDVMHQNSGGEVFYCGKVNRKWGRGERRQASEDRSGRREERGRETGGEAKVERKRKRWEVGKAHLLSEAIGNVHRWCSLWLQLRIFPFRTSREGQYRYISTINREDCISNSECRVD